MKKIAELKKVDIDDNTIQYITDSMANNLPIQIQYEGSGWRTIQPYSFTTSQDNNILVMCYKQDGSIRSYRLDRIEQLFVEDALISADTGAEFTEDGGSNHSNPSDYEIPYLPEYDDILEMSEAEESEPFNDALDDIESADNFVPNPIDEDGNEITDIDEIQKYREKEQEEKEKIEQENNEDVDFDLDEQDDINEQNTEDNMPNENSNQNNVQNDTTLNNENNVDFDLDKNENTI
nr:MAG TPA: WYL domain protein [Caudoviricetes sp.]